MNQLVQVFREDLLSMPKDRAWDMVVTIEVRPGQDPAYHAKLIRKRKSRRRKEAPDPRQLDMLA